MSQNQNWKVQLYPEEQAFIDEIWSRIQIDGAGRGRFLAPLRGGVIWIDDEYYGLNEDQIKWLLLVRLHNPKYQTPGFKGIKFMNFAYHGELPGIQEDAEAIDKWGVKRMTTDGQPVSDTTGWPLAMVRRKEIVDEEYEWNPVTREFQLKQVITSEPTITGDKGEILPLRVLE